MIVVTNVLSFILFFISGSTSYFGNDRYMALTSKLANLLSSINFSSFMFSTKLFEFLIKCFLDVVSCCNSFDKGLPVLCTAEFCVLVTSKMFN